MSMSHMGRVFHRHAYMMHISLHPVVPCLFDPYTNNSRLIPFPFMDG